MKCEHCEGGEVKWARIVEGEGIGLCDTCVYALDHFGSLPKLSPILGDAFAKAEEVINDACGILGQTDR